MSAPVIGFAGLTHLGLCSAIAAAAQGFRVDRLRSRRGARRAISQPASCRSWSRASTSLPRDSRRRITFTAEPGDLAACDVVYVAPDVPTDDAGESDLSAHRRR